MLIFMGRSPSDITEYRCDTCNLEFDFRASDWERRADYLEPLYCPGCGKPNAQFFLAPHDLKFKQTRIELDISDFKVAGQPGRFDLTQKLWREFKQSQSASLPDLSQDASLFAMWLVGKYIMNTAIKAHDEDE